MLVVYRAYDDVTKMPAIATGVSVAIGARVRTRTHVVIYRAPETIIASMDMERK